MLGQSNGAKSSRYHQGKQVSEFFRDHRSEEQDAQLIGFSSYYLE